MYMQRVNMYLSSRGYVVPKDSLNTQDLETLKEDLTVAPQVIQGYGGPNPCGDFRTYLESNNKLYIPKFYGLQKYGVPSLPNKIQPGDDIQLAFTGSLRALQKDATSAVMEACHDPARMGGLLSLRCGEGKCLAKDTKILMFDGSLKNVQDILVGDMIMGDDSTPRTVLSTCTGQETMYKVIPTNGEPYNVNESHILSLKSSVNYNNTLKKGDIVDISVRDYLKLPKVYHGKSGPLLGYRVPIMFPAKEVEFDPYMLGYWLGDGDGCREDEFLKFLQINNKHIPHEYKCNSRDVRLQVLAGILDANGNYNGKGYDIGQTSETLIDDVIYLARSLGFAAYKHKCSVHIDGNGMENIPTKIPTKRANVRKQIKDVLMSRIKLEKQDVGDYYGFEIDGNRRFVLGDFTVTHNTVCGIYMICQLAKKTLIVVHKEFLLDQWKERILEFAPGARLGLIKAKVIDVENKDIVLASLQSLAMKNYDLDVLSSFGTLMIDECHHMGAQVFSQALKKVNFRYSIGLTATPKRKDGLTKVFTWFLGDIVFASAQRKDSLEVHLHRFYDAHPDYSRTHMLYTQKPNVSKMINSICDYVPRVDFVVDLLRKTLASEPLRKVLILSDRRQHLHMIKETLDTTSDITSGFYYGGLTAAQLKESESKQVLLATFQYASEGFDMKGLDTLILASPKSDVIQVVGRILRDKPEDRKHIPLVIDIMDDFSVFPNQAKKRHQYYKSCKYVINDGDDLFPKKTTSTKIPKGTCLL